MELESQSIEQNNTSGNGSEDGRIPTFSRHMEFFDVRKLEQKTSRSPVTDAARFIATETIDNAIQKTATKNVVVMLSNSGVDSFDLTICDDGIEKFSESAVAKIADLDSAPSNKKGRKVVGPGFQGNALQQALGFTKVSWFEEEEEHRPEELVYITTGGRTYSLSVSFFVNEKGERDARVLYRTVQGGDSPCCCCSLPTELTSITFRFPLSVKESANRQCFEIIEHMSWLILYVNFWYIIDGEITRFYGRQVLSYGKLREMDASGSAFVLGTIIKEVPVDANPFEEAIREAPAGNIHCYETEEAINSFYAEGASHRYKLGSYLQRFEGLKNMTRTRQHVLAPLGLDWETPVVPSSLGESKLKNLIALMKQQTRKPTGRPLPCLGKAHFEQVFAETFVSYKLAHGVEEIGHSVVLPWKLEICSIRDTRETIYEYVDGAYVGKDEIFDYVYEVGNEKKTPYEFVKGKGLSLIIHAISPNFQFKNEAKTTMRVPFVAELFGAMKYVTRNNATRAKKDGEFLNEKLWKFLPWVYRKYGSINARQYAYRAEANHIVTSKGQFGYVDQILTELREEGVIPWSAVLDSSREFSPYPVKASEDSQHYLGDAKRNFKTLAEKFGLPKWQYQKIVPVIITEKEGLVPYFEKVAEDRALTVYAIKGQAGKSNLHEEFVPWMLELIRDGRNIVVFYLGDCDDDGYQIPYSLLEIVRRWTGVGVEYDQRDLNPKLPSKVVGKEGSKVIFKRLALTPDQVEALNLSKDKLNPKSKIRGKFVKFKCELEALDPSYLRELITSELDKTWDGEAEERRRAKISEIRNKIEEQVKRLTDQWDEDMQ